MGEHDESIASSRQGKLASSGPLGRRGPRLTSSILIVQKNGKTGADGNKPQHNQNYPHVKKSHDRWQAMCMPQVEKIDTTRTQTLSFMDFPRPLGFPALNGLNSSAGDKSGCGWWRLYP
jgi:hypothetical protein